MRGVKKQEFLLSSQHEMSKVKIDGLDEINKKLKNLDDKVARKIIKKGINDGTKIVLKEMKSLVPIRTGLLRKSLGRKVKAYRKSKLILGLIGPRMGFVRVINGKKVDPTNYAHLVEFGHGRVKPKPFVRPARDNTKNSVMASFVTIAKKEITDYARKSRN